MCFFLSMAHLLRCCLTGRGLAVGVGEEEGAEIGEVMKGLVRDLAWVVKRAMERMKREVKKMSTDQN